MTTTPAEPLRYAGFWLRLGAGLLDIVIMVPLMALVYWGSQRYRLFDLYFLVPGILFGLFYHVYLVRRFGGTPGKLIVRVQIRKVNGDPVGYREAFLRYLPDLVLVTLMSVALLTAVFRMSDSEYHALTFQERNQRMIALASPWYKPLKNVQRVWVWGEFLVLLTNRKRRALHDFIAGTVVVQTLPVKLPQPVATMSVG